MGQPYVGEIRIFAGNFPPNGWMFCNGQLLPISENDVLFQLIGTTYGGDGNSTFNLPNLQSRVPIHMGSQGGIPYQLGEFAGQEQVTLTTQQMPAHTHPMIASLTNGSAQTPGGNILAQPVSQQPDLLAYGSDTVANMSNQTIVPVGGSQPHDNCQPFLCLNYIISLFGVYPSPT